MQKFHPFPLTTGHFSHRWDLHPTCHGWAAAWPEGDRGCTQGGWSLGLTPGEKFSSDPPS